MAYQIDLNLFDLIDERELGDLERLVALLDLLRAEKLIKALERARRGRRNENPVRRMWYCVVACALYCEGKISRIRAELQRNQDLRRICHVPCVEAVPSRYAFKRFQQALGKQRSLLEEIFDGLIDQLHTLLPHLGRHVAADSTGLMTHKSLRKDDGVEREGSWGKKRTTRVRSDGVEEELVLEWFGFKLHLLVDAAHEVPLTFQVTGADESDTKHLVPLLSRLRERHPLMRTETVSADKGYDSAENVEGCWTQEVNGEPLHVKAVVALRDLPTPEEPIEDGRHWADLVLRPNGELCCERKVRGGDGRVERELVPMTWVGFEADRVSHKFGCPAKRSGLECLRYQSCNAGLSQGRTVRLPCSKNWRGLPPLPQGSMKRERIYKGRTSVERAFGRLKGPLGLEHLPVRSKGAVTLRVMLGILVLVALALWRVRQGQREHLGRVLAA